MQALFDVAKAKDKEKEASVNPLVQDGKKLVPSVTRVFSTAREIYVYFQAYKQQPADGKTPSQPIFAFVSLYLSGNKVFETPPVAVEANAASRLGTTPMSFSLGVNGLPSGNTIAKSRCSTRRAGRRLIGEHRLCLCLRTTMKPAIFAGRVARVWGETC